LEEKTIESFFDFLKGEKLWMNYHYIS
jgi:hypothetical protein